MASVQYFFSCLLISCDHVHTGYLLLFKFYDLKNIITFNLYIWLLNSIATTSILIFTGLQFESSLKDPRVFCYYLHPQRSTFNYWVLNINVLLSYFFKKYFISTPLHPPSFFYTLPPKYLYKKPVREFFLIAYFPTIIIIYFVISRIMDSNQYFMCFKRCLIKIELVIYNIS